MAVKLSKMVTDRVRWFKTVESRLEVHGPEVAAALEALLRPGLSDGEAMPDQLTQMRLKMRRLGLILDRMVDADVAHTEERAGGAKRRRRRDNLTRRLQAMLIDMRDMIRILHSRHKAMDLGFENRIMHRALPLLRQAERILGHLRDPTTDLPPSTYKGAEITPAKLAQQIDTLRKKLRAAVDSVTQEEAAVQQTVVEKQNSIRDFDDLALLVMTDLAASIRLAGKPELAKDFKVLPRRAKKPRSSRDEDGETSDSPDPALAGSVKKRTR